MRSPRLLIPAALCAGLLLPATAGAAEYCVATTTPCTVPLHNLASVQAALEVAAAFDGDDKIRVGPGEHAGEFSLAGDDAITLVGEGAGATTLAGTTF
jgi:hypothetical protein